MKKKLVIKFWKAEKALVMQILEQEGLPKHKNNNRVRILLSPSFFYEKGEVYLRGQSTEWDYCIASARFESNQDRDQYLDKVIKAITDEIFTSNGELKIGEYCEFSMDCEGWITGRLLAVLPDDCKLRYIMKGGAYLRGWDCFNYAQPKTKRTEPKVETNGEVITYTWEEE